MRFPVRTVTSKLLMNLISFNQDFTSRRCHPYSQLVCVSLDLVPRAGDVMCHLRFLLVRTVSTDIVIKANYVLVP